MRQAAKIDSNQPLIVKDISSIPGFSVHSLAAVPKFFDVVVGHQVGCPKCGFRSRTNTLLEIKNQNMPPSKRVLTPAQVILHDTWQGRFDLVCSVDEALEAVGL